MKELQKFSMSKNNHIYFSDLDGTLLNQEATISDYSLDVLTQLIQNGLQVGVASARNLGSIKNMLRGLPLKLPVISLNGAYISDINTLRHLEINDIEQDVKAEIAAHIEKHQLGVFVSNHHNGKDGIVHAHIQNEGQQWYLADRKNSKNQNLIEASQADEVLNTKVTCFTFIERPGKLEELSNWLSERFPEDLELHTFENIYSRGWFWLTAHSQKATKSRAIQKVMEMTGQSQSHLTVFGDGVNDLKMFAIADKAIAMQNAPEKVRQKADLVIGDNQSDSVARYLANL